MKPFKDTSDRAADSRKFVAIGVHSWPKFIFCVMRASDRTAG
jgi:hypothetical protein